MIRGVKSDDSATASLESLQLYIYPSEMTDTSKVEFTYTVISFDQDQLVADIEFKSPSDVSATREKDELYVRLIDFRDNDGGLIANDTTLKYSIPNQISAAEGAAVATAGSAASSGVGAATSIQLVLKFLMRGSLNGMLSSIQSLQIIIHLSLMNVVVPASSQIFFKELCDIITFDPIDVETQIK